MNEISTQMPTNITHIHTNTERQTHCWLLCELNDIKNDGYQVYTKYWYQDIYHWPTRAM